MTFSHVAGWEGNTLLSDNSCVVIYFRQHDKTPINRTAVWCTHRQRQPKGDPWKCQVPAVPAAWRVINKLSWLVCYLRNAVSGLIRVNVKSLLCLLSGRMEYFNFIHLRLNKMLLLWWTVCTIKTNLDILFYMRTELMKIEMVWVESKCNWRGGSSGIVVSNLGFKKPQVKSEG